MDISVKIDGVEHRAQAQIIKGQLWVHYNGRTLTQEVSLGRRSGKKSGSGASSDKILAPMPGKVTKLLLPENTEVQAGQAVLVMEAMKMEYTLKADIAGKIEKINCTVGEQVSLGKLLVKIQPLADK